MKGKRNVPEQPGIDDRLSSLPDEMLSHILSFLPTKCAVGTAVLSRRWKDIWAMVSNLDFEFRDSELDGGLNDKKDRRELFARFVDRVLSQHRGLDSVRRFRLHFVVNNYNREARPDFGFERELVFGSRVEEIDVRLVWDIGMEFGVSRLIPESFYTLKNLRVVKLYGVTMAASGSVSLPSVKILHLDNLEIKDFQSLSRIISGCPALETLNLELCILEECNEKDILIASLLDLRRLIITDFRDNEPKCLCQFAIEAPKLEHLYLEDFTGLQLLGTSPLPCLYSAVIDTDFRAGLYENLLRLLTQISNAKDMFFYDNALEFLFSGGRDVQLPVFSNLTHLRIEPGTRSWMMLSLLHSTPNLQSLDITVRMSNEPMIWEKREPARTPQCLLSSLKEIEIKGFELLRDDFKMIRYLLIAGASLKKVGINMLGSTITERERKELRSLLKLPRASSACDIRFLHCGNEIDDDETNTDKKDKSRLDDKDADSSDC